MILKLITDRAQSLSGWLIIRRSFIQTNTLKAEPRNLVTNTIDPKLTGENFISVSVELVTTVFFGVPPNVA